MKISQLSAHYLPVIGGQEVYINNLIKVCEEAGHTSRVYQLYRGERSDSVTCYNRIPGVGRMISDFDKKYLNFMVKLLKPKGLFDADVAISHYAFHAKALESIKDKTILLSHGVEWRVNNQQPNDKKAEQIAKYCLDKFPHIVNDTHYLRVLGIDQAPGENYFEEVSPGKWFIPNCVDTDLFSPGAPMEKYKNKKMILVPRQMCEIRGIHLAIKAFALLSSKYDDYELCLLGKRHKGHNTYVNKLDMLIKEHNLEERVYFQDPVPNHEMPSWFRSAQLTIVPTLEKEGTSLSAIESMACGTATITTNIAGLADLPSYQCEANAESIAEAIESVLENKESIATQQLEVTKSTLNMKNWSEAWLNVINEVKNKNV